jgi:hypothetical protein
MHSRGSLYALLGGEGGVGESEVGGDWCSFLEFGVPKCIFKIVLSCSHQVPNGVFIIIRFELVLSGY